MSSALGVIVPRWEWRTFGSRFGIAEERFAALTPGAVQESDEVYLVGGAGDNVKVRADLMDVKVLRETGWPYKAPVTSRAKRLVVKAR